MGLINSESSDIKHYVRTVKTEMAYTFLTVHDEIDFIADRSILTVLTKKLSLLLDLSAYYKKYNVPYVRYLFDVEYDKYGAWTAGSKIMVYNLPFTREEGNVIRLYKKLVAAMKPQSKEKKIDTKSKIEVSIEESDVDIEKLVSVLESIPQGGCKLCVRVSPEKSLKFYKKLDFEKLTEALGNLNLKVL